MTQLSSGAAVRLALAASAAIAAGAPALAQVQRAPITTPVERLGAGRLALKPTLSCTPVCIKQGCMPELKNTSASTIASGTEIAFSTKPEGTAKEYPFNIPKELPPGATHRVLSGFLEMASCRAWVK